MACVGIAVQPWQLISTATNFLAVLNGFGVFMAPATGVMLADYHVLRKHKLRVIELYIGDRSSHYGFHHGFNWRASAAFFAAMWPLLPGLVASVNSYAEGKWTNWPRLYNLTLLVGVAVSFATYLTLIFSYTSPAEGLGVDAPFASETESLDGRTPTEDGEHFSISLYRLSERSNFSLSLQQQLASLQYFTSAEMAGTPTELCESQPISKRKAEEHDPTISPPPMKRQIQSAVNKRAVANFFTPTSQRPKSQVGWEERSTARELPTSLLVARFKESGSREQQHGVDLPPRVAEKRKIAAFDLDSTLIITSSGKKHADSAHDWKWFNPSVPERLRGLHRDGFTLAIFSNQGGLSLHPESAKKSSKTKTRDRVAEYKQKCNQVLADLALPVSLYAAAGKDHFRKPRTGMWDELCADLGVHRQDGINLEDSFFVGDAAGRGPSMRNGKAVPKDFSCSDRNMAANIGLPFYTPEEFFLGESPRPFERSFDLAQHPFLAAGERPAVMFEATGGKELLVFCGPPGSGKSTFYREHLEQLGFERVNQDTLKTKEKCFKVAEGHLAKGKSVAVDNTNPDLASRAVWVELGKKHNAVVRCVWFKSSAALCEHNDAVRAANPRLNPDGRTLLPKIAFNTFFARFKEPSTGEGFDDVTEVQFTFRGTREEYALWGQYWV